jgi:hypothetical protein
VTRDHVDLKIGDIGYIEGDPTRPAIVLGLDKDDDGNEFVRYETLGAGVRVPKDRLVSQGDVAKAQEQGQPGPQTAGT